MLIKVVSAYEDDAALEAAMTIYSRVTRSLASLFEFHDSWWHFDDLAHPPSLELAAEDAADADIVFCCPSYPHTLPRLAHEWLRLWFTHRSECDGAFALILPTMEAQSSCQTLLERDLRETARLQGLAFFVARYALDRPRLAGSLDPTALSIFTGEELGAVQALDGRVALRNYGINE